MRYLINKEEMKKEWVIEKWYEKTYYIIGIIFSWMWIVGIFIGIMDEINGK